MKYNIYAKAIWTLLTPTCFKNLNKQQVLEDVSNFKRESKKEYQNLIAKTPSIGKSKENPMIPTFLFACMVIAIYKLWRSKITNQNLREMLYELMNKPIIKMFVKKPMFTEKWQNKRQKQGVESQKGKLPYDWQSELKKGESVDEFQIIYYSCAICSLAGRERVMEIVSELCYLDYKMADLMGAKLERPSTIAKGDAICDFKFTKKI